MWHLRYNELEGYLSANATHHKCRHHKHMGAYQVGWMFTNNIGQKALMGFERKCNTS